MKLKEALFSWKPLRGFLFNEVVKNGEISVKDLTDINAKNMEINSKLFYGVNFSYATFNNCEFNKVKFEYSLFMSTDFTNCSFKNCEFEESVLKYTCFKNCNFEESKFKKSELLFNIIRNSTFTNGDFNGSIIKDPLVKESTGFSFEGASAFGSEIQDFITIEVKEETMDVFRLKDGSLINVYGSRVSTEDLTKRMEKYINE